MFLNLAANVGALGGGPFDQRTEIGHRLAILRDAGNLKPPFELQIVACGERVLIPQTCAFLAVLVHSNESPGARRTLTITAVAKFGTSQSSLERHI